MAFTAQVSPCIQGFFDKDTSTVTYVVAESLAAGTACAVIDSVLNFDHASGRTSTESADAVIRFIEHYDLKLTWILETHAHADHLSAAPYLRARLGGRIAIGHQITTVQHTFARLFNLEPEFQPDGRQFDHLLSDNDTLPIGNLMLSALAVPGHTPACMAYQVGHAVFVGDTLFMPDVGTARCDFPGGNARTLYRSIQRILALPDPTRLFMCHDYPPNGRAVAWECTVADQKAHNIHVHDGITEDQFVAMRTARDATLSMPRLILPSIQINIRAGQFPPAESNGVSYLKLPLNAL